jgi:hypothetical protein
MNRTVATTTHSPETRPHRISIRRKVAIPGRLTWRDATGTLRFVSVVTRDVSDTDVFVVCQMPASIPLFRLVHFQVERSALDRSDLPPALRRGKLLSAVYRVGPYSTATGTPQGYAIRLLSEPAAAVDAAATAAQSRMAVAN